MMKQEDIKKAVKLFKEWDNSHAWEIPKPEFVKHVKQKAENSLKTAQYLIQLIKNNEVKEILQIKEDYNCSLWIINCSYYSMFFLAQYLLALDNKKMPDNVAETHKTTVLAILYYFIIKGSGLEGKENIKWEQIQESRMSKALEILAEAQEETRELSQLQAKKAVEDLERERKSRARYTYLDTKAMDLAKAELSFKRAKEFRNTIASFIRIKFKQKS